MGRPWQWPRPAWPCPLASQSTGSRAGSVQEGREVLSSCPPLAPSLPLSGVFSFPGCSVARAPCRAVRGTGTGGGVAQSPRDLPAPGTAELSPAGAARGGSLGSGIRFAEGVCRNAFPSHQSCCVRLARLCLAELCQTPRGGWGGSAGLSLLSSFWKPPPRSSPPVG